MPRERAAGWTYPDPDTTAQVDAREEAIDAGACPICGALVPARLAERHMHWHTTPSPTPVPKG